MRFVRTILIILPLLGMVPLLREFGVGPQMPHMEIAGVCLHCTMVPVPIAAVCLGLFFFRLTSLFPPSDSSGMPGGRERRLAMKVLILYGHWLAWLFLVLIGLLAVGTGFERGRLGPHGHSLVFLTAMIGAFWIGVAAVIVKRRIKPLKLPLDD